MPALTVLQRFRFTAATLLALLLLPAVGLWRWPRPQAQGIERLLPVAALLQSFPTDPLRPPPLLWQERLGQATARQLWGRSRGGWWQFWDLHGDGGVYLVLRARQLPPDLPARAGVAPLPVDDLLVLAPDALARRQLQELLQQRRRRPRGLEARCRDRLAGEQAVFWNGAGLAGITGPLAPLLTPFQQGCLQLETDGDRLLWSGEAAAADQALAPEPPQAPGAGAGADANALPPALLLELRGDRLDPLLRNLLGRALIRQPLARRYGLTEPQLRLLRGSPFLLRLRPLPSGPFQASLELELLISGSRQPWQALLEPVRRALLRQGLQEQPVATRPAAAQGLRWLRQDGTVVGGWGWPLDRSGQPASLLLHLGPSPAGGIAGIDPWLLSRRGAQGGGSLALHQLQLRLRPTALVQRSLLPAQLPVAVQQASQLELRSEMAPGREGISRLRGSLRLGP